MERDKEESLMTTYRVFMDIGLGAEDLGRLPALVDERIFGIGTAVDEKIYGIPDVEKLIQNQKKQSEGLDISWRHEPTCRYITEDENTAVFADDIYLTIRAGEEIMDMYLRFSVVLHYVNGQWKVVHWHGSKPEHVESEKDTWGVDSWKQRAQALELLVEEKTVDLVNKNRELEIVAALEKVRAAAMGMREPADMADVCRTISLSLDDLGFTDIRNVQTAVFYPEKGIYLNYEYFKEGNRSLITEVAYREQPDVQAFVNEMLAGPESVFARTFEGDELRQWTAYQHKAGQYVPPRQESSTELYYLFHSIGSGALGLSAYRDLTDEQRSIMLRFRHVFAMAYRRYGDIEKAQAQAREAQVEAALENVRSRALAMQKSNELIDVVRVLYEKLGDLMIPVTAVGIGIYIEGSKDYQVYVCGQGEGRLAINTYRLPYFNHRIANDLLDAREKGLDYFSGHYPKEEKDSFYAYVFEHSVLKDELPDAFRQFIFQSPVYTISAFPTKHAVIHINDFEGKTLSAAEIDVLRRFAHVFEQAYTRFLDLQKAEDQAREAQVEAALERVRSRSLSMRRTDELQDVVNEVARQLLSMGIAIDGGIFVAVNAEVEKDFPIWASAGAADYVQKVTIPFLDSPIFTRLRDAVIHREPFLTEFYSKAEKDEFLQHMFRFHPWNQNSEERKAELLARAGGYARSVSVGSHTAIGMINHHGKIFSEAENGILRRFGAVLEQSYTRFLDLQTAEAQAREAEIELALERIRAQAMGMKESVELLDIVVTMRREFTRLGHEAHYFWHMMWLPDKYEKAMTSGDGTRIGMVMELPRHIHGDIPFVANWEKGHDPTIVFAMDVDAAVAYIDKMIRLGDFKQVDPQAPTLDDIRHIGGLTFVMARTTHGEIGYSLPGVVEHPPAEDLRILERFAGAFDIAHRRFLDLKKSEARARDVQVELALERVRSRTMAMRRSDELNDVAFILFQQLRNLGGNLWGTGFGLCTEDGHDDEFWFANEWGVVPPVRIPNTEDPAHARMKDGWMQKAELLSLDAGGEALQAHYEYLLALPAVRPFFQHFLDQGLRFPEWQQWNAAYFNHGYLLIISLDPYPEPETLKRFARVFEQAYTRFLDLQRAEAQARTAMIEAALERVRARALAMQEPEELREIAKVLRHEMGLLGVEELETSTVFIHDRDSEKAECWFAIRKGSDPEEGLVSDHISLDLPATWVGRQMEAFFASDDIRTSIPMKGPHRRAWIEYCYGLSSTLDGFYGESIPDRIYHLYKFSNGAIGAAAPGDISPESWDLLQRTASVFSLAYARFRDLTQARIDLQRLKDEKLRAELALSELRAAQAQLVQSEKMASLGELTAGIAHEIKNPLNFVNNFAEVSGELFDELKATTDPEQRTELIDLLQNNLDKINEHGKRADAIVRSMLQHSRSESGKKEPTDLNALADEYLRLAYHGLRAKDKSFNATFKAELDPALPKLDIVPQDIGRVLLNLINNAFYAVAEKQRQGDKDYVPTVVVRTRCAEKGVELSVQDNGNGIPDAIREKIFQPFFTTKPTGQGTGLGLSLSYDIIKAHGGILTIASGEGKGATFSIELPFSS